MERCAGRTAVVLGLVLGCAPAVSWGAEPRLKPGVFLYASPSLTDPNFVESVVLLLEHGAEGSLGLVINHPSRVPLREALKELGELSGLDLNVYRGGPMQPEAILALVRSPRTLAGSRRVFADVHLSGDMQQVKAVARGADAEGRLRVYSGYAGWSAGQLAAEVRLGAWFVAPADAASVFTSDPSRLWDRVHELVKRIEARAGKTPVQARRGGATDPCRRHWLASRPAPAMEVSSARGR
jgi:putative transcriptional regulator